MAALLALLLPTACAAGGTLLTRKGVTVSVSLSDGALGLYITIPEE